MNAATLTPRDGFDRMAYTYDARLAGHWLPGLESPALLSFLPDVAGRRVADIGCGTGRYALQLARCGAANVIGVDISWEMLAVARRKAVKGDLPEIEWAEGDLCAVLPVETESQDMAVCALTLSFVPDINHALQELARILTSGGTLLLSDYHPHTLLHRRAEGGAFTTFMDADGLDYQILQYPHTFADLFQAARNAGLTLQNVAEPVPDRATRLSHTALQNVPGVPQALVLYLTKA